MTEAELPRDPDSSALADEPAAPLRRILWLSSLLMGTATLCLGMVVIFGWHTGNGSRAMPAWIKRTSCGRMTTEVLGNGEFS